VERFAQKSIKVRIVKTQHYGASHARNVGIRESKGSILLFADADAVYASDYLEKGVNKMNGDATIGAVCVTGTIWIKKSTFVSRGIALEYEMKQRYLREGKWGPYFAFLYRKEAIERTGGFDERLFQGEDKDLFERVKAAGYKIGLVDGFNWHHLYPQDIPSLVSRSYRGGKQRVVYVVKKGMYTELLRRVAGLWGLVVLVLLSVVFLPLAIVTLAILALIYAFKVGKAFHDAPRSSDTGDVLRLPLLSAIRYLVTAVGYTKGLAVYVLRRALRMQTTWEDL